MGYFKVQKLYFVTNTIFIFLHVHSWTGFVLRVCTQGAAGYEVRHTVIQVT